MRKHCRRRVAEARPERVVHLAAASSVAASWTDAGEPWRVNALGTVNLLEAVRSDAPGARVLVVSTGDVYGQADEIPTPETAPYRPTSPVRRVESGGGARRRAVPAGRLGRRRRPRLPTRGPRTRRALRGRFLGRPDRPGRGSRARDGARRRPQPTARHHGRSRRDRRVRGPARPAVPAGTYNVASGKPVAMREVLDDPRVARSLPDRGRGGSVPLPEERGRPS